MHRISVSSIDAYQSSGETRNRNYRSDRSRKSSHKSESDYETTPLILQHIGNYNATQSLSITGVSAALTWENLNVFAIDEERKWCGRGKKEHQQPNHILKNVSGFVEPGQLVAVLGASGSGKTTLLNALTARNISRFEVTGKICVNGQEMNKSITSISAYVQHSDLFIGTMTVREHLKFQAKLRLSSKFTASQKRDRVEEVIAELGLSDCANSKIGISGVIKGISGGEMRRLAFASEIITNPSLIFCDEPTTGLDSYMAESVVRALQRLAANGRTIICTIHQPSSEIYEMFDRVMFMTEGKVAYFGNAKDALQFFHDQGYDCPENYNPADFLIHTLAVAPGDEEQSRQRLQKICEKYEQSEYFGSVQSSVGIWSKKAVDMQLEDISHKSPYKVNWFVQFGALVVRCLTFNYRNPQVVLAKAAHMAILALFVGLLYLNSEMNQRGVKDYNGALFFILAETSFPAMFDALESLPREFPIIAREHHDGMYKVSSYYAAKVTAMIPVYSVDGTLFATVAYYMIGLRPDASAFFTLIGISIVLEICSSAFGMAVSALSPRSFAVAMSILIPIETVLMLTGGFFANVKTLPSYISWVQYISWFRYAFEAYTVNQWHEIRNITCETPQISCLASGDDVLNQLNFNPDNLVRDILAMLGLFLGFHILGYLALWYHVKRAR